MTISLEENPSRTKPNQELRGVTGRGLALTRIYEISNAQTITRMRIKRSDVNKGNG
jgi:hypothetical protein